MCMICKGLEKGKFSPEDAREKLEEFVDLDLLDEDHQEEVESLIAEAEEEEFYWASAKKDVRKYEDYDDEYVDEEEYADDYSYPDDEEDPVED
jgi:hypothetical protein